MEKVTLTITPPPQALPKGNKPRRGKGRPRKFSSQGHLEALIDEFFDYCKEEKIHPNKAEFALYLYTTKETLGDYESGKYDDAKNDYSYPIKRAYMQMESHWVGLLAKPAPAGAIFYAKNAFGYRDTVDHTSGGAPLQFALPAEILIKHQLATADPNALPPGQPPIDGNKDVQAVTSPDAVSS